MKLVFNSSEVIEMDQSTVYKISDNKYISFAKTRAYIFVDKDPNESTLEKITLDLPKIITRVRRSLDVSKASYLEILYKVIDISLEFIDQGLGKISTESPKNYTGIPIVDKLSILSESEKFIADITNQSIEKKEVLSIC